MNSIKFLYLYKMEEVKRRFRYSEEDLKRAMVAVQRKEMTLCKASASFNIPKGTLSNKLNKKVPLERKMGPKTYLSKEEENRIKNWILAKAAVGFPVRPDDIRNSVQNELKQFTRDTPFVNCKPDQIKNWFAGVKNCLINENCADILDDSRRILNCDETGMNTCPETGKVLCLKQMPNFYEIANGPEKECTIVLCSFSADGTSFPPMVVYPYKRIPAVIVNNLPNSWVFGRSDSVWSKKRFHSPVILFLDGHSSHLSLDLSEFCVDKQIHLYCLPPNATHILQLCDVSIFKPLKSHWKKEAFDKITIEVIKNVFKACGLYPFDENAVDYDKCIPNRSFNTSDISSIFNNDLKSDVLPRPTIDGFLIAKHVIKFILQDKLLIDNDKIRLIIEECNKSETPDSEQIQSNVDGFWNFDIQNMPMKILDDTFNLNMFDDIVYDNLHCTNNKELINHDEKKTDEPFNSEENIETVTINCDRKKTDELLINSEENIETRIMNNENKAGKTGIKTSNLSESLIDNVWSTHFPWPKTPSSQKSTKSSERKVPYAIT
ncbi:hypothetical protein AGLY_012153 [Aphis glycines]|uniref:HTH psq-type domain-containing protein n=1 Tax=Aphis glycines TaxID=307491 RepID=A0A6G0TBE4_APHGL|nr:hypothetical protein AGLY_012153 [Aphis glycines]